MTKKVGVNEGMVANIEDVPALNRAGAYVIHDMSTGKFAGKILVAYPKDGAGMLRAALWDFTPEHGRDVQNGHANGYGYDKSARKGLRRGGDKTMTPSRHSNLQKLFASRTGKTTIQAPRISENLGNVVGFWPSYAGKVKTRGRY